VIEPPGLAGIAGHASVTAIAGAVVIEHVAKTLFVIALSVQTSRPIPLKAVVTAQVLVGAMEVPVKLASAPGASVATVNTVVLAAGRSLSTTTLVNVTLPVFCTVPLYVNEPPGSAWVAGQTAVTAICGVVRMGQVALTVLVTGTPQRLLALATKVSDTEQLAGAT
jgi:hypothetical protein